MPYTTPILFLVFNRPNQTKIVFDRLRNLKPKYLYIAADGPRANGSDEMLCQRVQSIVMNIDWDCDVKYLIREKNLGCKNAISESLSWFFEYVEEGIILEDDCLPNDSFFEFMSYALNKYKSDESVFSINGSNFGFNNDNYSYGFTRFMNMWGWGTWRSSLNIVDYSLSTWRESITPNELKKSLGINFKNNDIRWLRYWENIFDKMKANGIDTWDYQWIFAGLTSNQKSIFPYKNLVQNIGFDSDATHTTNELDEISNLTTNQLSKPYSSDSKGLNLQFENDFVKKVWCQYIQRPYIIQKIALLLNRGL